MADARGVSLKSSLGMELRTGHVHLDRYGGSPAPPASHRPVRGKRKSQSVASHASNRERPNIPERERLPELPRLRALENQAVEVPVSVSSAASAASPRSGSSLAHPYNLVGEAVEGSSYELAPSTATRAASISERDESMDMTPIRGSDSSPVISMTQVRL